MISGESLVPRLRRYVGTEKEIEKEKDRERERARADRRGFRAVAYTFRRSRDFLRAAGGSRGRPAEKKKKRPTRLRTLPERSDRVNVARHFARVPARRLSRPVRPEDGGKEAASVGESEARRSASATCPPTVGSDPRFSSPQKPVLYVSRGGFRPFFSSLLFSFLSFLRVSSLYAIRRSPTRRRSIDLLDRIPPIVAGANVGRRPDSRI